MITTSGKGTLEKPMFVERDPLVPVPVGTAEADLVVYQEAMLEYRMYVRRDDEGLESTAEALRDFLERAPEYRDAEDVALLAVASGAWHEA
ncbi:MAG: hypothetical protein AAFU79_30645, partial [Myxococcota bacterium]